MIVLSPTIGPKEPNEVLWDVIQVLDGGYLYVHSSVQIYRNRYGPFFGNHPTYRVRVRLKQPS